MLSTDSEQARTPDRPGLTKWSRLFPLLALLALVIYTLLVVGNHLVLIAQSEGVITASQGDYANYAEIARVYLNGGQMYVDYWTTKPPGIFLFLTPFVSLWGNSYLSINIATILIILLFIVGVITLAHSITRSTIATLGAASLALIYSAYQTGPETTMTMTVFAIWAYVFAVRGRGRFIWTFAAGFLFAVASISKQPILIEAPFLLGITVWFTQRTKKSFITVVTGLTLGGLTAFSILALWASSEGILEAMLDKGYGLNIQYVLAEDGAWLFSDETATYFQEYFLRSTVPYLRPLFLAAALSFVVAFWQGKKRGLLFLLLFWFLLAFLGAAAGRALLPRYFFEVLPPLLIITALGISTITSWNWQLQAVAIVLLAVSVFSFIPMIEYPQSRLKITAQHEQAAIAVIEERLPPDECLWTWGQVSAINYLSGRLSCASPALNGFTMDANTFPIHRTRIEYMHEIMNEDPILLIDDRRWGFFPQLENFADRYVGELIFENDLYDIYTVDRSMWHEADVNFENQIRLIGYDLLPATSQYCVGDPLTLAMTWEQISIPEHQYQMFVHLLTQDEQMNIAAYDGPPEDGRDRNATNTWVTPTEIRVGERFDLLVPEDVSPGRYKLVVGLYDVATLERASVLNATGDLIGNYTLLQNIDLIHCS